MKQIITQELQRNFIKYLYLEEKSKATISKYTHDVSVFAEFADKREVDKDLVLSYKTMLGERYAVSAANSMIAALNTFFVFVDGRS